METKTSTSKHIDFEDFIEATTQERCCVLCKRTE